MACVCTRWHCYGALLDGLRVFRVRGSRTFGEGRLESYCGGEWRLVCKDINMNTAHTLCRHLGFVKYARAACLFASLRHSISFIWRPAHQRLDMSRAVDLLIGILFALKSNIIVVLSSMSVARIRYQTLTYMTNTVRPHTASKAYAVTVPMLMTSAIAVCAVTVAADSSRA